MSAEQTKVFISYSRNDRAFADRLADALEAEGIAVFRDVDDILPAEEWKARIETLIGACDSVVFVISPEAIASEVCGWEIELVDRLNKRLAPIVRVEVEGEPVPERLSKLNYIFFTEKDDFERSLESLVSALEIDIDWIREHTRLGELARRWDAQRRLRAQLLRGRDLSGAEAWLASPPPKAPVPTVLHHAYIQDSRRAAVQRQRYWLGGSLAVAGTTALLAVFAYLQTKEAERRLDLALATANGFVESAAKFANDPRVPRSTAVPLIGEAEAAYAVLTEQDPDTPKLLRSRAYVLLSFAGTYSRMGDTERLLARARQARDILKRLTRSDPENTDYLSQLALSHVYAGRAFMTRKQSNAALAEYSAAVTIREQLTQAGPANATWKMGLLSSYQSLARVLIDLDRIADGLELARKSRTLAERQIEQTPSSAKWRGALARVHSERGIALRAKATREWRAGRDDRDYLEKAFVAFKEGVAVREAALKADPKSTFQKTELANDHVRLGLLLSRMKKLDDALAEFEAGRTLFKQLVATAPNNLDLSSLLAEAQSYIGTVHREEGRLSDALRAMRQAIVIRRRLAARDPENILWQKDLAHSHMILGHALALDKKPQEGLKAYLSEAALRAQILKRDPRHRPRRVALAESRTRIGDNLLEIGNPSAAQKSYRTSLDVLDGFVGDGPGSRHAQRIYAVILSKIAETHTRLGDRAAAIASLRRAVTHARALVKRYPDWQQAAGDLKIYETRLAKLRPSDAN